MDTVKKKNNRILQWVDEHDYDHDHDHDPVAGCVEPDVLDFCLQTEDAELKYINTIKSR